MPRYEAHKSALCALLKYLPSFLDGVPAHKRVQDGINGLTHVLNQDAVTVSQGPLDCIQITAHGTRNHSTT